MRIYIFVMNRNEERKLELRYGILVFAQRPMPNAQKRNNPVYTCLLTGINKKRARQQCDMSKFISTTFGYISGRHGTAVAAVTKNGNVIRVFRSPSNPNTPKQQEQRLKFGLVNKELSPLGDVFKTGYASPEGRQMAVSHALRNAIEGEFPDFRLNFGLVKVAAGNLPGVHQASAQVNDPDNNATITWDTTVGIQADEGDAVNLVFFNQDTKLSILHENVAVRKTGTIDQVLPEIWKGKSVHCWLYLSGNTRSVNSDSIYVGFLQL